DAVCCSLQVLSLHERCNGCDQDGSAFCIPPLIHHAGSLLWWIIPRDVYHGSVRELPLDLLVQSITTVLEPDKHHNGFRLPVFDQVQGGSEFRLGQYASNLAKGDDQLSDGGDVDRLDRRVLQHPVLLRLLVCLQPLGFKWDVNDGLQLRWDVR